MIINVLVADDKNQLADSIEGNLRLSLKRFNDENVNLVIKKAFTSHAYKHGKTLVESGFNPDICVFDLVFNGDTGMDLYNFIINHTPEKKPFLCIYTGTESNFKKRQEAEELSSASDGKVCIITKPNINRVIDWFNDILESKFKLIKKIEKDDPFDLL